MKEKLKLFLMKWVALAGFLLAGSHAEAGSILDTINEGTTGTTSATVFIPAEQGAAVITDIGTRVDAGNSSATIDIREGLDQRPVTSSTAANGTTVWFNNTDAQGRPTVSAGDYIILEPRVSNQGLTAANQKRYSIGHVSSVSATAAVVDTAFTVSSTVSTVTPSQTDLVWTTKSRVRRPTSFTSSSSAATGLIFLPSGVPSAITLDGNTTSCQLSASGYRTDKN